MLILREGLKLVLLLLSYLDGRTYLCEFLFLVDLEGFVERVSLESEITLHGPEQSSRQESVFHLPSAVISQEEKAAIKATYETPTTCIIAY